ncbi:MAG: sulfite exporter TauE/SafE family protein [Candidatus Rokubacteria bacterium]|nr:sulfite exporter TauE/SafE family protein [Candidatus Rokubacteria bacterium]
MDLIRRLMTHWYVTASQWSATLAVPVGDLADRAELPLVAAFLFGLVGAVAPCQLTTNLSAMAYVGRRLEAGRPWREALAYIAGKVIVYTVVGAGAILLGLQLQPAALPVVVAARKGLGPLMIVIGLGFLGLVRLRGSVGRGVSAWLEARLPREGVWGAFLLGVAFSFTFCPTLFWLFFGLTIPMALRSVAGVALPGAFAVGTALPLVAFVGLVALGSEMAGGLVARLRQSHRLIGRLAGAIFILAGIHDTLTYWAL